MAAAAAGVVEGVGEASEAAMADATATAREASTVSERVPEQTDNSSSGVNTRVSAVGGGRASGSGDTTQADMAHEASRTAVGLTLHGVNQAGSE